MKALRQGALSYVGPCVGVGGPGVSADVLRDGAARAVAGDVVGASRVSRISWTRRPGVDVFRVARKVLSNGPAGGDSAARAGQG